MRTIILLKYAHGRVSYLLFTELIRKVSESLCCQWTILMHCCADILGHAGDRLFTDIVEKWLLNECRQCCDLLKNDHSLDAILNSFQITWTWDWKTIVWRLLTSGNLFNGIDLISFNCFQESPTGWTAYFILQRCLTFVEQERQHCWSTSVELWDNSFTTDLFFCMKTPNKGFVTLKISSGFCEKN